MPANFEGVKDMAEQRVELSNGEVWVLHSRKEKNVIVDGMSFTIFHERWVHKPSASGIVLYSYPKDSGIVYHGEGYGIGTIDPETFKERQGIAPIQPFDATSEAEVRQKLHDLMLENTESWIKHGREVSEPFTEGVVSLDEAVEDPKFRTQLLENVGGLIPNERDRLKIRRVIDEAERAGRNTPLEETIKRNSRKM